MKSIPIISMALGLCAVTHAYSSEVFTVLGVKEETREYLDFNNSGSDSWGTYQSNNVAAGKQIVRFHPQNNIIKPIPYPQSFTPNLKPKGSEITHGMGASDGYIEDVWPLPDGSVLFYTNIYPRSASYLYKLNPKTGTVGNNAPAYDNKQAVMNMGERNNVPQIDIRALHHRSLLVATIDAATVLFYGEYNVSKQDQVALWKSTDLGDTWSKVVEWNTVGHQTRHIHAIVQNPYNNLIYILFGDEDSESAIVAWDGKSAPPPDNTPLNKIGTYAGWKAITGSQRVRAGDVVFTPPPNGKLVWIPDADILNPGQKLHGQRANYDLTGLEETGEVSYANHLPAILGARSNTGNIYWVSYRDSLATEKKVYVWKSTDAGLKWTLAAKVDTYTDWTSVTRNFHAKGNIVESITTDYLTIQGRDLEFIATGKKVGNTANFSSKTIYPKSSIITNADTVATLRGSRKGFDLAKNDIAIKSSAAIIIAPPKNGTAVPYCCGRVLYTPKSGFAGVDTFSYALQNSLETSNTSAVTVYVINAQNDTYTTTANTASTQTISVTGPNGVGKNDLPNVDGRTFAVVSRIKRTAGTGKARIALSFNAKTGSFNYTLTTLTTDVTAAQKQASKRGTYQFTYTMTLGGVTTAPLTAKITVK